MIEAKVASLNNMPTLYINNQPATGLMHFNQMPETEESANFRQTGVNLFSFMGNLFLPGVDANDDNGGQGAGMQMPTMTPEYIDAAMERLIAGNPDILVMPRIRMISPAWWNEAHPKELMRHFFQGQYTTGPLPSPSSGKWLKESLKALTETIRYFEKRWSDRVIGYHTGYGECAEHVYAWNGKFSDYSIPQLNAFRKWLKEKYGKAEDLRKVWNKHDISFETAEIPTPDQRGGVFGLPVIYDPKTEQQVIDYQMFHSEMIASVILEQASIVKNTLRELGREKIFGIFYAYVSHPANCPYSHYNSGHDAHEKVLECPDIDFIASPLGYSSRQPGGCCAPQVLSASIAAHGKLYYAEDDTGTHLVSSFHHGLVAGSAEEFVNVTRRNFLTSWSSGASQWWMDLRGGKWFHDKTILEEISNLSQFAEYHLENRNSIAQIAIFVSDRSMSLQRQLPVALSGVMVEQPLNELCTIGAPFDLFRLEDIPILEREGKLEPYRMCIFLNAMIVPDHVRSVINSALKKNNRTLCWNYLPGIVYNGKFDTVATEELTGMKFNLVELTSRDSMITEFQHNGSRFCFGSERNIFPRLTGNDPNAEALGFYVEGTQFVQPGMGTDIALMAKKLPECKTIWSSAPDVPGVLWAKFARECGVHLYSAQGDQIITGPGWIGIHAKTSGDKDIALPCFYKVIDYADKSVIVEKDNSFSLNLKRGETRLLLLK